MLALFVGRMPRVSQQRRVLWSTLLVSRDIKAPAERFIATDGYFKGKEALACEPLGVTPYVPKPLTSGSKAAGRFGKRDFVYIPEEDAYRGHGKRYASYHFLTMNQNLSHRSCRCEHRHQRNSNVSSGNLSGRSESCRKNKLPDLLSIMER
jgi:hypothetical protein